MSKPLDKDYVIIINCWECISTYHARQYGFNYDVVAFNNGLVYNSKVDLLVICS